MSPSRSRARRAPRRPGRRRCPAHRGGWRGWPTFLGQNSAPTRARGWDWRRSPARPDPRGFVMPARGANALGFAEAAQVAFDVGSPSADARVAVSEPAPELLDRPLGAARAQVHETYIVAQTRD